MSKDRIFEGKSHDGNVQQALDHALRQLDADLSEGGVRDASASWVLREIAGEYNPGFNVHDINVKISAERSPDWGTS